MNTFWHVLLWACIVWILPLIYFVQRNETKPKKNLVLGVTLPYEAQSDPLVLSLCARFRRQLTWLCVALLVASLPILLVERFSLAMTILLTWLLLVCVLPSVLYALFNHRLKALKQERGWSRTAQPAVVDLKAAAVPVRWYSPLWFLPPLLVSLIPVGAELMAGDLAVAGLCGIDAALVVLFYFCYRWLYRNRAEVVGDNTDLTAALTRLRRRQWGLCWIGLAYLTGLFNVALWLTMDTTWALLAVTPIYTIGVVLLAMGVEFRVRRQQEKLTAGSGQGFYVDEDDRWIWGMFYYNPNDSHLLVNARTGINTTFNLARRAGQVITVLTAAVMLCLPLIGLWLMREEMLPVELSLTGTALVASHSGTRYEIPLDEVAGLQLLEERPPMTRVMGTGMDTVLKGRFSSPELGALTVCLDPRTGPYLYLTTLDGHQYLFGNSDGTAAEVYHAIQASP